MKHALTLSSPMLWVSLTLWACLTFLTAPAAAQQAAFPGEAVAEQRYCTQFGPFMIRFDRDRAAGFFAALPPAPEPETTGAQAERAPGAVVGVLVNRTLEGAWLQTDKRGFLRMGFSDDWSSFIAAYALDGDPDTWRSGWMGYLPPAGDPPTFAIDGDQYHCD